VLTALSSTTLSGYIDTSAIWKPGTGNGPFIGGIVGRAFDGAPNKLDGFNLNVAELSLSKPLDEGQWAAGYNLDLLAGPDAVGYNTAGGGGDFGIKQAAINLRAPIGNGLDIKMGVWNTPLGYEVFESPNNPNYSRSYGWQLEPTQHTGVLFGYRVNDMVSLSAGVANTHSAGIGGRAQRIGAFGFAVPAAESEKTYMGTITFTAPESAGFAKGATLTVGGMNGLTGNSVSFAAANNRHTTSLYAGLTTPTPVSGLSAGAAFDYKMDAPRPAVGGTGNSWAWAAAGYVTYQCSEKLKVNGRFDYTDSADGIWYASAFNGGKAGNHNTMGSVTVTVDYSLWANVITRGELRWDHSMNGEKPYPVSGGGAGERNATTLALNVIYKF
jgi:hypothetical protein